MKRNKLVRCNYAIENLCKDKTCEHYSLHRSRVIGFSGIPCTMKKTPCSVVSTKVICQ